MKSTLLIAMLSFSLLVVSCGPSAEDKALLEKAQSDSIDAARAKMEAAKEAARQQMIIDSLNNASDSTSLSPDTSGAK